MWEIFVRIGAAYFRDLDGNKLNVFLCRRLKVELIQDVLVLRALVPQRVP